MGSMRATEELIDLCHVDEAGLVLDVGCGVGATPCYLARAYSCRVIGMDLLPKMAEQAQERAADRGVGDRVGFLVGDARYLPFDDDVFDAVIAESVNVFFTDKIRPLAEYVRVTKPGGYVGITEMTWLTSPSQDTIEYYRRTVHSETLEAAGWKDLLERVGLRDVGGNAYKVSIPVEGKGRIRRYGGCRGMIKLTFRALTKAVLNPKSREFLGDVFSSLPKDVVKDVGYGVYVGRKT
jgi:SAM-dependent methyltransferase